MVFFYAVKIIEIMASDSVKNLSKKELKSIFI